MTKKILHSPSAYENLDPATIPYRWFIVSTMILQPRLLRRQMSLLR